MLGITLFHTLYITCMDGNMHVFEVPFSLNLINNLTIMIILVTITEIDSTIGDQLDKLVGLNYAHQSIQDIGRIWTVLYQSLCSLIMDHHACMQ